ncbi:hypothetical protein, partial [Nocardia cerradoensis]|uniref:hypothetical protein n=1 Tax=Nocardia cerradoensis TaxID=85688 RepID=UPI0016725410
HSLEFVEAIESRGRFGVELVEPVGVDVESPASFLKRFGEVVDEVLGAGHEAGGELAESFVAFVGGEALLSFRVQVQLLVLDRAGRDRESDGLEVQLGIACAVPDFDVETCDVGDSDRFVDRPVVQPSGGLPQSFDQGPGGIR